MQVYTVAEAARLLHVHPTTLREFAQQGKIRGSKLGRSWRFTEEDIREFLERQRPEVSRRRTSP